MYTVDFLVEGMPIESIYCWFDDEQVWLSAGFDLVTERGNSAERMQGDVIFASQALKGSPDYFRNSYGDKYLAALRALDDLHELCESYPDAIIDVRY